MTPRPPAATIAGVPGPGKIPYRLWREQRPGCTSGRRGRARGHLRVAHRRHERHRAPDRQPLDHRARAA